MSNDPEANPRPADLASRRSRRSRPAPTDMAGTAGAEYDVHQMRYMSDLEHVRERTGMYIGNRDVRGLHHLVTEVVDNSIDEVMAGFAKVIQVTVNADGSITVADDGRGIPVDTDPSIGRSALEGVMTMLKYGGKFDNDGLQDLRRPARHRREGGQFPLRVVRGRGPPRRPRLPAGIRARQADRPGHAHRHRPRAPAPRPPSSPTTRSSAT